MRNNMYLHSIYDTNKNNLSFNIEIDIKNGSFEFDKYINCANLNIYESDDFFDETNPKSSNLIAKIEVILFDYDLIERDGEDIIDIADSIEGDVYSSIFELVNSKYFDKDELYIGAICYLERFYIMPKYRNKGIGKYLINNLCDLIKYHSNINIEYIVAYLKPLDYIDNKWMDNPDASSMKKKMVKFYKNNFFKQIGRKNYYVFKKEYISE